MASRMIARRLEAPPLPFTLNPFSSTILGTLLGSTETTETKSVTIQILIFHDTKLRVWLGTGKFMLPRMSLVYSRQLIDL